MWINHPARWRSFIPCIITCVIMLSLLGFPSLLLAAAPFTLVTGPKTGTYIAIGRDIARVGKSVGVPIDIKTSDGSIDNIKHLNGKNHASLAIVQSDVLGFLKRSQNTDTQKMAEHLRVVMPLYYEEVHVLARNNIHSFAELKDKRVIVGEDGSGHMLTAINLLAMMNITPSHILKQSAPDGIVSLLDNEADALIYIGGKPVKLFQNLATLPKGGHKFATLLSDLHFVPLNDPRMLEEYPPATIGQDDYDFVHETIPTIAVTAILVDYDYSAKKTATLCRRMHTLTQGIIKQLPELQKNGHPKWQQTIPDANLSIWKKDSCAWGNSAEIQAEPEEKSEPAPAKKKATSPHKKSHHTSTPHPHHNSSGRDR